MDVLKRYITFFFTISCMLGCTPATSELNAVKRHQLTGASIISSDLSRDGALSALVTDTLLVQIWNIKTLTQIAEWDANRLGLTPLFLDISGDKSELLLTDENQILLLDINSNTEIGRWPLKGLIQGQKITAASYFKEINAFAVGMNDGTIFLADLLAGVFKKAVRHNSSVTHFALDSSQQYILSAGHDGTVNKLSRDDLSVIHTLTFEHRVSSLVVDDRTNRLFVSDVLDNQTIFDGNTFNVISELRYSQRWRWFRDAKFIKHGQFLITASPKTAIFLWDVESGEQLAFWDAEVHSLASQVVGMAINSDNQLVTSTNDAVIEQWQYQHLLYDK